jgi:hypothetical protein
VQQIVAGLIFIIVNNINPAISGHGWRQIAALQAEGFQTAFDAAR